MFLQFLYLFIANYGHGVIDFARIFKNPQYVTRINGFLSSEKLNVGVTFNINNELFQRICKSYINRLYI